MEFDQTYAGTDWSFPSPNATPTNNTSFNGSLLQTPKTSTFAPSHFQDAFSTPQMPSYATPHQAQYSTMTPQPRPQASSDVLHSNIFASGQQVGNGQNIHAASQPIYHGAMVSPMHAGHTPTATSPTLHSSFGSAQMQTPPPTRGASARKSQSTHIAFGTPSTIASRRFASPQEQQQYQAVPGTSAMHQTPSQFPPMHFSPGLYQFANGPASAPALPHSHIFWNQNSSHVAFPPQRPLDDPFAPGINSAMSWTAAPSPINTQTVAFDNTPAMASSPVQNAHPRPSTALPFMSGLPLAPMQQQATTSGGVDPSLLYTSPMRPGLRSDSQTNRSRAEPHKPTMRKDSGNSSQAQLEPTARVTSNSFSGPSLRRSNTTGGVRPKSVHLALTNAELSRSNSTIHVPRTASPLKRIGRTPLGPISELRPSKRASVVLTIDENGNARTETRPAEDSPTKSMRQRYPGLFDSDSSDDESDTSEQAPSRSTSFTFAKGEERRSKAARLDPPVENLEGLSIPRPTSSASSTKTVAPSRAAIAAAAQLRRQGSLRKTRSSAASRRGNPNGSTNSLIDSCSMDPSIDHQQSAGGVDSVSPDGGIQPHWGNEYSHIAPRANSALDAHNRRWSLMSYEQQLPQSVSPQHHSYHHTPRPQPQLLVRCVCGTLDDQGQMMVQCQSCTQWLHSSCIGVRESQPSLGYTCFLCTKPSTGIQVR